jgi:hypothetical protein
MVREDAKNAFYRTRHLRVFLVFLRPDDPRLRPDGPRFYLGRCSLLLRIVRSVNDVF